MVATAEHYVELTEAAGLDTESLTVLVVAGATRDEVVAALSVDLDRPVDDPFELVADNSPATGWALADVAGGVLALEPTGYGDPSPQTLARLSAGGRSAAVARANVQAHERFGCARDGELAFDDDEYMYAADGPARCPAELRDLFDTAWDDLSAHEEEDEDAYAGLFTALAMVERWTGVELTADDLASVGEGPWFRAPAQVYVG